MARRGDGPRLPARRLVPSPAVSDPAELVRSYLQALSGDDPDLVARHVAEDFRNEHLSALGTGSNGRTDYRRRLPDFLAAFPERRYAIHRLAVAPGEPGGAVEVVVRYRFEATYDGHPVAVPGVAWFEVVGGVISSRVDTWDSLTFLRQTGQA